MSDMAILRQGSELRYTRSMSCLALLVLPLSALLRAPVVGNRQEPLASRPDSQPAEAEIVLTELHGAAYPRGGAQVGSSSVYCCAVSGIE